jgi:hypothetical protein
VSCARNRHPRPSHPASRFVTIAIRPSCRGETTEAIYFWQRGFTRTRDTHLSGKSVLRGRVSAETRAALMSMSRTKGTRNIRSVGEIRLEHCYRRGLFFRF